MFRMEREDLNENKNELSIEFGIRVEAESDNLRDLLHSINPVSEKGDETIAKKLKRLFTR